MEKTQLDIQSPRRYEIDQTKRSTGRIDTMLFAKVVLAKRTELLSVGQEELTLSRRDKATLVAFASTRVSEATRTYVSSKGTPPPEQLGELVLA